MMTDSYKASHWKQYPKGTTKIYSYLESRGSKMSDKTLFFGLQYYLKRCLVGKVIDRAGVDVAEKFWEQHLGPGIFDRTKWDYIVENLGGKLPIKIRAVREGEWVPNHNVLLVIENTDPNCFWLTNFLETLILKIWYSISVATNSGNIRKLIGEYLDETADRSGLDFKCQDFGYRGVSSEETAGIGDMSHLVSFNGTDAVAGIWYAREFYNTDDMLGFSVTANEHSVVTSWLKAGERDCFRNMLETYPTGIVSCVSDSFHILEALEKWGELKDIILNRDGTLVIRPDSGDPAQTDLKVINRLGEIFGYTINDKGYRVLDSHVRVLQGDGIEYDTIKEILELLKKNGWSADNLVFGCGGKLLQAFNRDTFNFAIKCSFCIVNGEERYVEKSPVEINASGELVQSFKKSKKGELKLVKVDGEYKTLTNFDEGFAEAVDELVTVYENGELLVEYSFEEIRTRARE